VPRTDFGVNGLTRLGSRSRWPLLVDRSGLLSTRRTVRDRVLPEWTPTIHGNLVRARQLPCSSGSRQDFRRTLWRRLKLLRNSAMSCVPCGFSTYRLSKIALWPTLPWNPWGHCFV